MRLLPAHLEKWRPQLTAAQLCYGIPLELMAAILDRESRGGEALTPKGPGGKGDHGRGHGLAQIDSGYHHKFLAAMFDDNRTPLWADPTFNVLYGARLLSENFRLSRSWPVSIAAYNAGLTRATRAAKNATDSSEAAVIAAVDRVTTGGDYVSDVYRRRAGFGGEA